MNTRSVQYNKKGYNLLRNDPNHSHMASLFKIRANRKAGQGIYFAGNCHMIMFWSCTDAQTLFYNNILYRNIETEIREILRIF